MKLFVLAAVILQASFACESFVYAKEVSAKEVSAKESSKNEASLSKARRQKAIPTLVLSEKKAKTSYISAKVTSPNAVESLASVEENREVNVEQYKQLTRKKQDWKAQLKNLAKDISTLEDKIKATKDEDAIEHYTKQLYELKYYRSIANIHLKNYGKATVEAKEVVKFDESYLLLKPSMFFNKTITFNETMEAVWYMAKTVEETSCNNGAECLQEVGERYSAKWHEGSHDYTKYEAEFFNNPSFADIKTIIASEMGASACVGACLVGIDIDIATEQLPEVVMIGASTSSSNPEPKPNPEPEPKPNPEPNPNPSFCSSFENKTDKYSLYASQISAMGGEVSKSVATAKVRAYLCRGFSNIMMIDSGINANASYISNARNDIKSAIAVNSTLSVVQQVDEIDDIIDIDALFGKYNAIITKGMTAEDMALAQHAISQEGLNELKTSLEGNMAEIEYASGVSEYLTDSQKADIAAAYGKNPISDPYGDPKVQTASITSKANRATIQNELDAQANLQDLLDAILDLQKNGNL